MPTAISSPTSFPSSAPSPASSIPPLENGDRLTRAEFERRYTAMPHVKKAELIEGVVYMASPVRFTQHGKPHAQLITWLGYYVARTPGLEDFSDNATLRLDEDNEPQPDISLRLPQRTGGQSRIGADGYLEGPVEFIAEVAASSVSLDMHAKLNLYRRHRVLEYLVWRVDDAALDWFAFREGRYELLQPDASRVLRSEVFPGLWLNQTALLAGDLASVLATIDVGLRSPEHAALVERLRLPQA